MDYIKARKQSDYLKYLCDAHDNLEAAKALDTVKEPQPAQDIAAQKLVYSNYVIGGSGDKAALLGTVGAAPTATEKTLTDIGFTKDVALSILDESAKLRTDALALRVVDVKPIEEPIK
jgi:hypothetical protein